MYSALIWIRAWQMPVHWFCSPWIHQFAWACVANNRSPGELANSCESGSLAPHPKSHAYLYPPGLKPLTEMLGYHVLQRKRQHLVFTPAHPVGSRRNWFKKKKIPQSLLLGDSTAQNTQKIFFPKCQDTIYITSVFNPYESILSSCIMSL